jgi:hypothetical protein
MLTAAGIYGLLSDGACDVLRLADPFVRNPRDRKGWNFSSGLRGAVQDSSKGVF